ncbi:3'-5' exonuclease [Psychromicrobium sp. YIM B11713]|uniref:3'-5' exonuclease n=1 Tax=Psychromicrobium sp. YIM B11713 TaxID=3145233 RepID=UPI00374E5EB2
MSNWLAAPRAAFDVETTGRDPFDARLVTASIVLVDPDGSILESHEWLADPGVEIPLQAAQIHGISTARAQAEGRPVAQVTAGILEVLAGYFTRGLPVTAFNASYDFTVLALEAARHGLRQLEAAPVTDPFIMDKQVDRFRKGKRTLEASCQHYGVPLIDAHTSAADALATVRLAAVMIEQYPELQLNAMELHRAQIRWAAEQAASFQEYLRSQGKIDAVIDGTWPVKR